MHQRSVTRRPLARSADAEDVLDTFLLFINTLQELERFLGADFVDKGKQPEG